MSVRGLYRPRLGAYFAHRSRPDGFQRARQAVRLLALFLAVEIVYIPLFSPRFSVREVELHGDPGVAAQVASRLSLHRNTNLLRAPVRLIQREAQSVPAVRSAQVARDLLESRIVVTLERREAMAVVRGTKEAVLVDATGVLFTLPDEWGWGLPELAAPHLSQGDTTSAAARGEVQKLLDALRALGPDPRLRIARLVMDRAGRIEVALDSGARVRLGSTDQLSVKTKLLATVISQLGVEKIDFLDLSAPWAAYWRPKAEAEASGAAPRDRALSLGRRAGR